MKITSRRLYDVFCSLFPSPTKNTTEGFRAVLKWNEELDFSSRPRIVFFTTDKRSDPAAWILPLLMASAGAAAPVVLIPPQCFWKRLSRRTGMRLDLSPHEFSHLMFLSQAAVCLPLTDFVETTEREKQIGPASFHSLIQKAFFLLCQSAPHFAVFDIKIGGEKNLMAPNQGFELAGQLHELCGRLDIQPVSVLSDFRQPAGECLGEHLKMKEALALLEGSGSPDMIKLTLELGTEGMTRISPEKNPTEIRTYLKDLLVSGKAKEKAREVIVRQSGNLQAFGNAHTLKEKFEKNRIASKGSGFIGRISWARALALLQRMEAAHPDSGIVLLKKTGDFVAADEILGEMHLPVGAMNEDLSGFFQKIFEISKEPVPYSPLILGRL